MYEANNTTNLQSLVAVIRMIYAKDRNTFTYYYNLATHGNGGGDQWYYVSR